mmetsp:Transcript_4159/g.6372  ORF Transcript_4159/g.6372 Transcript_4159/m.6372 type:complete len:395 (-) Transcript_4159:196-1380(-)
MVISSSSVNPKVLNPPPPVEVEPNPDVEVATPNPPELKPEEALPKPLLALLFELYPVLLAELPNPALLAESPKPVTLVEVPNEMAEVAAGEGPPNGEVAEELNCACGAAEGVIPSFIPEDPKTLVLGVVPKPVLPKPEVGVGVLAKVVVAKVVAGVGLPKVETLGEVPNGVVEGAVVVVAGAVPKVDVPPPKVDAPPPKVVLDCGVVDDPNPGVLPKFPPPKLVAGVDVAPPPKLLDVPNPLLLLALVTPPKLTAPNAVEAPNEDCPMVAAGGEVIVPKVALLEEPPLALAPKVPPLPLPKDAPPPPLPLPNVPPLLKVGAEPNPVEEEPKVPNACCCCGCCCCGCTPNPLLPKEVVGGGEPKLVLPNPDIFLLSLLSIYIYIVYLCGLNVSIR